MAMETRRCKNPRCNRKFKTDNPDREFCDKVCRAQHTDAKPEEFLQGKKVLFAARGQSEDGIHPNDRQLLPRNKFRVGAE